MSILESKEIQTICRVINFLVQRNFMLNPLFLKQTASDTHFASTTTIIVQQLNTAKSFMSLFLLL